MIEKEVKVGEEELRNKQDDNPWQYDYTNRQVRLKPSINTYSVVLDNNVINGTPIGYSVSAYASGTVYSLTATSALIDFGTTDPSLVLNKAGTYLLFARATLQYNAATFAANRTATIKLRRTNNTAADLSNASSTITLRIVTTTTDNAGTITIPPVIYTTTRTDDIIQLFGVVSVVPTAGSLDCTEAEIIAIRLY